MILMDYETRKLFWNLWSGPQLTDPALNLDFFSNIFIELCCLLILMNKNQENYIKAVIFKSKFTGSGASKSLWTQIHLSKHILVFTLVFNLVFTIKYCKIQNFLKAFSKQIN